MNATDLFPPSEYLKSADVEAAGGEMEFTIKGVERREYDEDDGSKKVKGVLTFAETESKLALNVTNNHVLQDMYGAKDIDTAAGWIGKKIILYVEMTKFQGKEVPGIRIRKLGGKQFDIDAFWAKARELGFTRQDGQDHLKQFNNDFKTALAGLENPNF